MSAESLKGRVVIVTGSGHGLGASLAADFVTAQVLSVAGGEGL